MAKKTNFTIENKKTGKKYKYAKVSKVINGKQKFFYGSSKKEAEEKRDAYIGGLNSGLADDFDKVILKDFMKTWLFTVVKNEVAYNTFDRYESVYRNYVLRSSLADRAVSGIQSHEIQKIYNDMMGNYSEAQIGQFHKLLNKFFYYCLNNRYTLSNPCSRLATKDKSKKEEIIVNDEEGKSSI